MTPTILLDLIAGATLLSGLLAGASADRYLVQVPAWRRLDPMTWAEHSRHADLGNGRFWYPILAFGASGLSVAAALGQYQRSVMVQGLNLPVYLAAVLSVLGLGMTALAAPHLLRLRQPRDHATTEASFRVFHTWGLIRAVFQILAFPINLWSLYVIASRVLA